MDDDRPPAAVIPLSAEEHGRAGGVLGRAFSDDPQWVALVPDPAVRRARLPEMFDGVVRLTAAARGRPERTAGFEAVALWLAPGRDIGLGAVLRSRFASVRLMAAIPSRDGRRMRAVLARFDRRRKALMPGPHWYLLALGTDPAYQRQGFGSQLVRHGLLRADRDGVPVYLEAETEVNAPFYERLGFETLEEVTVEEIDLRFSLMIRRPLAREEPARSEPLASAPSPSAPIEVRDARPGDRRAVVGIFTASFRDFPPLATIVGADPGADDRRRRLMRATLAAPSWRLHVLVAEQEGRVVGALTYADSPDCMAVSGLQARTYLRVYGPRLPAMVRGTAAILRMHPGAPHRHLPMVGVDPGSWGRGIGGLLLAEYTRRCDEAGLPGYLETVRYTEPGRPSHERLYGRHGFHVEHVAALDPEWTLLGMTRLVGGSVPAAVETSGGPVQEHRDPAERGILRCFYRDWRPTRLGRLVNRFWGWVAAARLSPALLQRLEVRGRMSGQVRSVPVVVLSLEGERYLVSMLGPESAWVRNVEAAGGAAVLRHGRAESVRLRAVPPDQRAPILREYVRVATSGRRHFPVDPGAPLAEFAAIAERYPAYRVVPA